MIPLLSICIPTFNRAARLRVMLQALMPQAADYRDSVEVLISDNASTDTTKAVVEEAQRVGPIQYHRNSTNIGIIGNVLRVATQLARGEMVWVLGDDDLLKPNSLVRVVDSIRSHPDLDAIYFNFCCARYPEHWPESALGGYEGAFKRLANAEVADKHVAHWHEIIQPESSMGTQIYAHIIRRSVWVNYWSKRTVREPYSSLDMTYPHSCMLAETMMHKPIRYVGMPVLTIFDNGQSWSNMQPLISLVRFPQLLGLYRKMGLPEDQLSACEESVFQECSIFLQDLLTNGRGEGMPTIVDYLLANWRFKKAWITLINACRITRRPRTLYSLVSAISR